MSTPSSIPGAIDGLLGIIRARPEIAANHVQVADGFPTTQADNIIAVGGTTNNTAAGSQSNVVLGGAFRDEDYTIELTISCFLGGTNQKPVRDKAFNLFQAVANGVRADWTLGGAVRYAQIVSVDYKATDVETASKGREATLTVGVRCQQRIAP